MRKVDDGKKEKRKEKRMAFLVATTSFPAVYRPNGYARTTTAGTPHARANLEHSGVVLLTQMTQNLLTEITGIVHIGLSFSG